MAARPREPGGSRASRDLHREDLLSAGLLLIRLVLLVLFATQIARGRFGGPDVERFRAIALHPGVPWRDFPLEYAPLQGLVVRALFGGSLRVDAVVLAVMAFAADVAAFVALRVLWGRRAGALYLALGLPILGFAYQRIDLLPVALAVAGLGLARRGRERAGGAGLALGTLFKLWPAVLLPAFVVGGRRRSLGWALGIVVAGAAAWIAVGGIHAPAQVTSFRGATGWQEESAIGSVVLLATGGPERREAGAIRVGRVPGWAPPLLALATIAGVAATWRRAALVRDDPAGAPSLVAVAIVVLASPVFSTQYVTWLLPWAAIAGAERRRATIVASVATIAILTGAMDSLRNAGAATGAPIEWLTLLRNALLIPAIAAWWFEDAR